MSEVIITVEELSKSFQLNGVSSGSYVALRDVMSDAWNSLWKGKKDLSRTTTETGTFWALKDISFEVRRGDRLGIIGRNGAGKSTLLKVLSRILEPSGGRVILGGRVASLLEVGTGFHPELTGRENVYMNGILLGMTTAEVTRSFDEIVQFAEVEAFIDEPLKHYSSGMKVRLAFAVAAFLEPDILIVDEVLAVGDHAFQKKCLGKMQDATREGRTVLFVSHQMEAVERLCSRGIIMDQGRLIHSSENMKSTVNTYLQSYLSARQDAFWEKLGDQWDNPWFSPLEVFLDTENGVRISEHIPLEGGCNLNLRGIIREPTMGLVVGYQMFTSENHLVFSSYYQDADPEKLPAFSTGEWLLRTQLPLELLNEGVWEICIMITVRKNSSEKFLICDYQKNPIRIRFRLGNRKPAWYYKRPGILAPINLWLGKVLTKDCDGKK